VFTEKRAGRRKSERGERHDRLMSDDDRPISFLDRLLGTEIWRPISEALSFLASPNAGWASLQRCPATNTVPGPHVQSKDVATRARQPFRGLGVAGRQPCALLTFSLRDTSRPVLACPMRVQ